jgi:hypothetical protein
MFQASRIKFVFFPLFYICFLLIFYSFSLASNNFSCCF